VVAAQTVETPEELVLRLEVLHDRLDDQVAVREGLPPEERAVLVLAALCHDLGKPAATFREGDRVRSPGHAAAEETLRAFLGRIGAPAKPTERIVVLTKYHLTHIDFSGSERHVRRLARALGEAGETIHHLARLVEADHSGRPPRPPGLPEPMRAMVEVAERLSAADEAPRPVLKGRHLLERGFEPGPEVGRVLGEAFEAQLDGAFEDLDGAMRWLDARLDAPSASAPSSGD